MTQSLPSQSLRRRGFSLVELAIVLGVISVILGALWGYAASARQNSKVQQSFDALATLVESTRVSYAATVNISGGINTVVPHLTQAGAIPSYLLRNTTTSCSGGTPNFFLNSPLVSNTSAGCGTLAVCDWSYGTQPGSVCSASDAASSQYFAVEFDTLDYPSCLTLAQRATPTLPAPGLKDIYINGNSAVNSLGGLPLAPSAAASSAPYTGLGCTPNVSTNTLDFVYVLRAPST